MADPIGVTPGQIITWDVLNTVSSQHGSPSGAKSVVKVARKPLTDDEKASLPPGEDPFTDQNPTYRYYFEDGSYVDAKAASTGVTDAQGRPQDTFTVIDYQPSTAFRQAQTKAAAADPANQTPTQQNEAELNAQRARNAALPPDQDPLYETDQQRHDRAQETIKQQGAEAAKQAAAQDVALPGVTQTTDAAGRTVKRTIYRRPDGTTYPVDDVVQAAPPKPDQVSAPSTQEWIVTDNKDGTYTTTKNPNWKPPSTIQKDPETGQYIEITQDADGKPVVRAVNNQTTIKPADLPVLQAKYGEISQGLGSLAADLNGKFARGEITEKQRNEAFAAGHQQAATQIAEINSILDNSRQAWASEITQRGQTLQDTAGRRTFAGNMLTNAISTGQSIANSSGPGHGAAIAGGVGALLNIGQRYAEGMGGFRESPEIAAPVALQQARAVGIPGLPMPAGPGAPPAVPPAPAAPAAPVPGTGISNTTDAGGVPRVFSPASSAPQSSATPGVNPLVSAMQQQLMGGGMFAGSPVAAGGGGVFDPLAEGERMLAGRIGGPQAGQDTYWEQAVQRAAQAAGQRPGYERFYS
jgi:hypothetical protein